MVQQSLTQRLNRRMQPLFKIFYQNKKRAGFPLKDIIDALEPFTLFRDNFISLAILSKSWMPSS